MDGTKLLKLLLLNSPQMQQALHSHSIRAPFLVPRDQKNSNGLTDLYSTVLKELQALPLFLSGLNSLFGTYAENMAAWQ